MQPYSHQLNRLQPLHCQQGLVRPAWALCGGAAMELAWHGTGQVAVPWNRYYVYRSVPRADLSCCIWQQDHLHILDAVSTAEVCHLASRLPEMLRVSIYG